jgi:hypothetical protein
MGLKAQLVNRDATNPNTRIRKRRLGQQADCMHCEAPDVRRAITRCADQRFGTTIIRQVLHQTSASGAHLSVGMRQPADEHRDRGLPSCYHDRRSRFACMPIGAA